MNRLIQILCLLLLSTFSFGQGVLLTEERGNKLVAGINEIMFVRPLGTGANVYMSGRFYPVRESLDSIVTLTCGQIVELQVLEGNRTNTVGINLGNLGTVTPRANSGFIRLNNGSGFETLINFDSLTTYIDKCVALVDVGEEVGGGSISEPNRQLLFGKGVPGADSDTSLTLWANNILNYKLGSYTTNTIYGRRTVAHTPGAGETGKVFYEKYVHEDPTWSYHGSDSLTISLENDDDNYGWTIGNHSYDAGSNVTLRGSNGARIMGGEYVQLKADNPTNGNETNIRIGHESFLATYYTPNQSSGNTAYRAEESNRSYSMFNALYPVDATAYSKVGRIYSGVGNPNNQIMDTSNVVAFMGRNVKPSEVNHNFAGFITGYFSASANGYFGTRATNNKGSRNAAVVRQYFTQSGANKAYDWLAVDFTSFTDSASNNIKFYNRRYAFPNAAPSTTTTTKSRLEWTGTGSDATPAFASTLTATATLDFPSTAAGTVSDLTVTVIGAADGDIVHIGVPNAAVTATASYFARVSTPNTVTIRLKTEATEDPPSSSFKVWVVK